MKKTIHYFGHPHPLQLTKQSPNTLCTVCGGLNSDGRMYSCNPCNFRVHTHCTKLPHRVNHPCHPHHPLTILPHPAYASGLFTCNACRNIGGGFNYHCSDCSYDLHICCAIAPSSITHHPHHPCNSNGSTTAAAATASTSTCKVTSKVKKFAKIAAFSVGNAVVGAVVGDVLNDDKSQ